VNETLYPHEYSDYSDQIAVKESDIVALETQRTKNEQPIPQTKTTITPADIVAKSYVMRQDVRSLMKVDRGQHCSIRKWISTQSFSLLSLSPQAGRNYVFIVNHLGSNNKPGAGGVLSAGEKFMTRMEDMDTAENMHLYSMFDLEKELGLIDLDCSFD
jgi:hypothetical protein